MQRHAGTVKEVYTGHGTVLVQHGKDLSAVSTVIGVGGVFAFGKHAELHAARGRWPPWICPIRLRRSAPIS